MPAHGDEQTLRFDRVMSAGDPEPDLPASRSDIIGCWVERLDDDEEWVACVGGGLNQKSSVGKVAGRIVPQGLFAGCRKAPACGRGQPSWHAATVMPLSMMMSQVVVQ